jgi:hypothetical protein
MKDKADCAMTNQTNAEQDTDATGNREKKNSKHTYLGLDLRRPW